MMKKIATGITWIFSPLFVPTYATLLLLYSGFHFSMFSWPAKRFLLLVIFVSTAIMPSLTLLVSGYGKKFRMTSLYRQERFIPMIFIALYYYLGYFLLNKMPIYTIFKVILLAGSILTVVIMLIALRASISYHMASAGALFGLMLALSLRIGASPVNLLTSILLLSGLTGTAIMITNKHTLEETLTAFPVGFLVFFLIFYYL